LVLAAIFPPDEEIKLVRDFFGAGAKGYFVEVGANDPKDNSQSFHLEQSGWSGILVEPQPDLAERLRKERSSKVYAVACSSPERSGSHMTLHVLGPFSSFDPALAVTGLRPEHAIEVPVRTLDEILGEARAPQGFDLLSVDVEGHELDVLRGFDFARWQPKLILLEDHVTSLAKHRFLNQAGYRLMRRTGLNGWYVPRAGGPQLDLWGRWQILRKYYLALPFRALRDARRRLRDRRRWRGSGKNASDKA
jgi:FkbM family methyltransferase